ncbi:hypothetical protein SAE02_77830 [Skermanella aerolata]|uniref:Uncharacterized protein n=1 Tax=Skermanella aerolata TaxID=393310 RepID=A0A512E4H4_9PROT|nr:hypothetical protein [Skermanella aerolata]GEO43635.1 hypothetical protein SAE02_77830 [Skermanella aerolata]
MRYAQNIDFLLASIIYLGSHDYYWARSPKNMAEELSLDEERLKNVFNGFPGIYRRSLRKANNGQHYYALQARYAQKKGGDVSDPEEVFYIDPLDTTKLQLLITFVLQSAEQERTSRRAFVTNFISITAAIIAAMAAVATAILKA